MADEVVSTLASYIANDILKQPKRSLGPDTRLISSGLVDSLSIVDLAIFVEESFGVKIKPAELTAQTFDTLGELASLVESRQKAGARRR